MSNEFKKNPTLTNTEEKILHIDNLRDELLPMLEMFSLMSPEEINQTRKQREKDGKTDDANRFKTSSIFKLQTDCLENLNPVERPEMVPPICNVISRLIEKLMPDIKKGLQEASDDVLYAKNDEIKKYYLTRLMQITEHLKQIAMLIENIDIKIE